MRSARIALFEHDPSTRNILRGAVNHPSTGHEVVSEALSVGGALHVVSLMRTGYRDIDAVIVGASLDSGEEAGLDAKIIVEKLRALDMTPKIIGCANVPMSEYGIEVDANILHGELGHHPHDRLNGLLAGL